MWHGSDWTWKCLRVGCAVALVLAVGAVLLPGCGESTADKQKEYRADYKEIINDFQTQVARDEAEAKKLLESNNATGLIKLNQRRLTSINKTFGKLLELYPPVDLRRIHAETLYYLIAVVDQIKAQNAYFEAVLGGKPTGDLESIATSATAKAQALSAELALDLQKANIDIKSIPSSTQGQTQSAPASSGGGARQ